VHDLVSISDREAWTSETRPGIVERVIETSNGLVTVLNVEAILQPEAAAALAGLIESRATIEHAASGAGPTVGRG
jgi:hypothetical protein